MNELEAEMRALLRKSGGISRSTLSKTCASTLAPRRPCASSASKMTAISEAKLRAFRALAEREARREILVEERERSGALRDPEALKRAAQRAQRELHLEGRLPALSAEIHRLEELAKTQLSSLGLGDLSIDEAAGLQVPDGETVERFARQRAHLEKSAERLAQRSVELSKSLASIEQGIEAFQLAGNVPTEPDLDRARLHRDESLAAIGALAQSAARQQLELAVARCGTLVRDADGSPTVFAAKQSGSPGSPHCWRRYAAHRERPSLHEEERELAERRRIDDDGWRRVFAAVGIEPAAPLEMKEWLQRHAALVQTAEQLRAERSELAAHTQVVRGHEDRLRHLLVCTAWCPNPRWGWRFGR